MCVAKFKCWRSCKNTLWSTQKCPVQSVGTQSRNDNNRQWFKLSPYSDWTCICCGINYVSSATEHISLCKPLVITSIEHRPWVNTCKTTNGLLVSRCCVLKCMPHSEGLRTVMGGGHTKPQATFLHSLPHRSLHHLPSTEELKKKTSVWQTQVQEQEVVMAAEQWNTEKTPHCEWGTSQSMSQSSGSVACWLGHTQYHTFQSVLQEYQFWQTNLVQFKECLLLMCNMYTHVGVPCGMQRLMNNSTSGQGDRWGAYSQTARLANERGVS